jgi:hypothetical protein
VLSRTNPPPSSTPNPFRFRTSAKPRILHYFGANKSFRISTYRHLSCNPFRMHTYKNTGGGGVAAKLRALLRSCGKSITFRYSQPLCPLSPTPILCFQQLRASFCKTPGWGGGTATPPLRSSFPRHMRHVAPLSPVPSVDCAYFPSPQGACVPLTRFRFLCGRARSNCLALCFHILTNCFSRNPFSFTTIRIAYGGGGADEF